MIERVTKRKELQLSDRRIDETKSLPRENTNLLEIESLASELPQNGALNVMLDLIPACCTARDARATEITRSSFQVVLSLSPGEFTPLH